MMARLSRRTLLGAGLAGATAPLWTGCTRSPRPPDTVPPSATAPLGLAFPKGFKWGAATSAYQIEGGATQDGRGPSIWDTFSHESGRTRNGDTGDVAADHYNRMPQDLDLMKSLGLRSYRFSISWSRVLPTGRGPVNQKGLDFYRRLVDGLGERGIESVATLYHWDLPQALQDRGGWENRDVAQWFADYATVMYEALGDRVTTWLTINEPKTIANVGYRWGAHAPGKRDPAAALVVGHHLLLAHGLAVRALRATGDKRRIGPALNLAPAYPASDDDRARASAVRADGEENRLYLDPIFKGEYPTDLPVPAAVRTGDLAVISSPVDILGLQYYNPVYANSVGGQDVVRPTSQATWQQIYPEGLYDILVRVKRDYGDIPITVTENGMPEPDEVAADGTVADPQRLAFIRDHLAAAHRAIAEGVRLEGYHVWSLLDNFEWAEGYSQRWGIVYVDFKTQQRIPKASARWYQEVIARNAL
jgi:beta-glucosidase